MKKNLILLCLIFFTMILNAQPVAFIEISVENEYTGILESPERYGITPSDLIYEATYPGGLGTFEETYWSSDLEVMYFMTYLRNVPKYVTIVFTINKPGHKLNGLKAEVTVATFTNVDKFGKEGAIFHLPD